MFENAMLQSTNSVNAANKAEASRSQQGGMWIRNCCLKIKKRKEIILVCIEKCMELFTYKNKS